MDKSILSAFTFMFKDKDWLYKLFILLMLYLPSAYYSHLASGVKPEMMKQGQINYADLALCVILTIFTCAISTGYLAKCTHLIIKNDGEKAFKMPDWEDDFWSYLFIGFKKGFAIFATSLLLSPTIVLFAIPVLIFSFIFLALDNVFCIDFKFNSYLDWKQAFSIITSNNKLYYNILFLSFVFSFIPGLFSLLKLPTILFSALFAGCMSYCALVYAYFVGILSRDMEV